MAYRHNERQSKVWRGLKKGPSLSHASLKKNSWRSKSVKEALKSQTWENASWTFEQKELVL